jgi:putative membrane protein
MKELARCLALFGLVAAITSPIYLYATTSSDPTRASGPSTIAADDLKFFEKAAQTGMTEVQAADIASSRGQGAGVKSFAEAMTADHTANNKELKALADRKGVTLPTQLDKKHQDLLADLQQLDAKKFDAEYAADMKKGHEEAVELFEKVSKKSKDADIRQFASGTLPTLQHHLEMAKKLTEKS